MLERSKVGDGMAKKKLDEQHLMAATEELLLEKGYDAFHFKLLSDKLNVGRSTLYEYYANKEELITVYMQNVMEQILHECEQELDRDRAPLEKLKQLLQIFLRYSQIHQLIQMIPMLKTSKSKTVHARLEKLNQDHENIMRVLFELLREAKERGEIRQEIPDFVIAGFLFQAIQIPNRSGQDHRGWSETIFDMMYRGMGRTE